MLWTRAKWIDRNVRPTLLSGYIDLKSRLQVLTDNLKGQKNSPTGDGTDATDQPGLKEMTLKAIDILQARSKNEGWFMM